MFSNMLIGRKINLSVAIVAFVTLLFGFIVMQWYAAQIEDNVNKNFISSMQQDAKDKFQSKKAVGISNAVSVANDGRIKEALKVNDRSIAIKSLKDLGQKLKKSTPFKNVKVHIHTKDNHSFVRIWKLDKFGDDLSGFRHSIVKVNSTKKAVNTFELGKAGLSLRSVVPVFDDNGTHLGSLEFMQGLNSVAKSFNKKDEGFILLMDKRVSSVKTFKANKIFKTNYIISQKFINKEFLEDAKNINMSKFLQQKSFKTKKYLYTYVDVKDFRNKKLGIAIVGSPLSKVDVAINGAKKIINVTLVEITVMVALILLVLLIVVKKVVTVPLKEFSDGIIEFFRYLNKESQNAKLLKSDGSDEISIMSRVVNKNITKTKNLIEQDQALIEDVKRVVNLVKDGYFKQNVTSSTQNESLEELKISLNEMLENISDAVANDLNKVKHILNEFQKLNFSHRIPDAKGQTEKALNDLADIINKMLVENKTNGLTLQESSDNLLDNVSTLSGSSRQAAASLEETAAALEQMTGNIANNTSNVMQMASHGNEVKDSVSQGQELANQTTSAMDEIDSEVTAISDSISVIDQISFQTNILSLNAAVEAATAGEAGKGFAVVAQEVRNLANRSADAANEIKLLVEKATAKADNGKKIADKMIDGYTHLNDSITKTLEIISDVEMASKEQLHGIEQINNAVSEIDQQTQQNANIASSTKEIAVQTQKIAHEIVEDVDKKNFIGKESIK